MLQQVVFVKSCHKSYVRLLEVAEDDYKHFVVLLSQTRPTTWSQKIFTAGICDQFPVKRHILDHENFLYYNITKLKYINPDNTIFTKFNKIIFTQFFFNAKFLWRFQLTINLIIIYIYLFLSNTLNTNILLVYLKIQLRVIFSKHEQKFFLKLILQLNKFFINKINIYKYNSFNNLILLQIIITGRWQRKRWVNPFPQKYKSGLVELNQIFKSYKKINLYLNYKSSQILTRKGIIGLRLFLFYKNK